MPSVDPVNSSSTAFFRFYRTVTPYEPYFVESEVDIAEYPVGAVRHVQARQSTSGRALAPTIMRGRRDARCDSGADP